jgi:predicted Zn-dependent peptidase
VEVTTMKSLVIRAIAFAAGVSALGAAAHPQQPPTQQKETPPAPGTPKNFRVPPSTTFTLPNGMQVTMVPFGRVPKVTMDLQVRTGRIDEAPNEVALSAVMGDMLREGTTTRTAQEISGQVADMGGSLDVFTSDEIVSISGTVLSDFSAGLVRLMADVAQHPRFDSTDLKRIIDKQSRDNAVALAQAGEQSRKLFREITYGNHPFARIFPPESMLRGYSVDKVRAFYAKNVGATRAHLYVSGIYDRRVVERAIREAFEAWPAGAVATESPPVVNPKQQVAVQDRANSVQSAIRVGGPVADPSNPDWIKLSVTDYLLGGAFGSRITSNIREDKGYTYSPFSTFSVYKKSAVWVEIADVTTNVTGASIAEIFKEVDRLRNDAPPEAELTGIKNNLAGVFVVQNSSRDGLINQMAFVDLHGLGPNYLESYVKNVMAVTPTDVRTTAAKYLDPSKMSIAIVGNKKEVEKQLGEVKAIKP